MKDRTWSIITETKVIAVGKMPNGELPNTDHIKSFVHFIEKEENQEKLKEFLGE